MLLTIICSRVSQEMDVSDTGRQFAALYFSPLLKTCPTFACRQSSGTVPLASDSLYSKVWMGTISELHSFNNLALRPSGPAALCIFKPFNNLRTP